MAQAKSMEITLNGMRLKWRSNNEKETTRQERP
jgi:hypothetical protein